MLCVDTSNNGVEASLNEASAHDVCDASKRTGTDQLGNSYPPEKIVPWKKLVPTQLSTQITNKMELTQK